MKLINKIRLIPALIIAVGLIITIILISGEKKDITAIGSFESQLVETVRIEKTDYQLRIKAWGFVEASETIDIVAEASGKIATVPADIFPGARIRRGALLFGVDERDYLNKLEEARAQHDDARQALAIEEGMQIVAKTEWEMLAEQYGSNYGNDALALREPQLKKQRAAVRLAAAREAQAVLDLERTRVHSPCDCVILSEHIAVGQWLERNEVALTIARTDSFYIRASYPPDQLIAKERSSVTISIGDKNYRGIIKSVLPNINKSTRQRQVIISFKADDIVLGAYAELELPGTEFIGAIVIPKKALRPESNIWLLNDSRLSILHVVVRAADSYNAILADNGLEGSQLIVSHIANPLQAMALRSKEPDKIGDVRSINAGGVTQ
jgi:RND family efflux transporter MFP subunit